MGQPRMMAMKAAARREKMVMALRICISIQQLLQHTYHGDRS
jgi:hypothetical protein